MANLVRLLLVALAIGLLSLWLFRSTGSPGDTARTSKANTAEQKQEDLVGHERADTVPLKVRRPKERRLRQAEERIEVRGFVLAQDKTPAPGAIVRDLVSGELLAVSKDSGEFSFFLASDSVTLVGEIGGLRSGPRRVRSSDRESTVILQMGGFVELQVCVVSAHERQPISGAAVSVMLASEVVRSTTATNESGCARLATPASGRLTVVAVAETFGRASRRVNVFPTSASSYDLTIALPARVDVQGTARYEDGTPADGAVVTAWDAARNSLIEKGVADSHGSFSFRALYPGHFRFEALVEGRGSADSGLVEVTSPTRTIQLTVEGRRSLNGLVVDASGRTVEGAKVTLRAGKNLLPRRWRQATTSERGEFRFVGIDAEEVSLSAEYEELVSTITARTSSAEQPVVIKLEEALAISGQVVGRSGVPINGALVKARRTMGDEIRAWSRVTTSDSNGTFQLHGLHPGNWELTARMEEDLLGGKGRNNNVLATVSAGSRNVTLELSDVGGIEGWVQYDDGSVPPEITIVIDGLGVAIPSPPSFLVEGIPPGHYNLLVTGAEFAPKSISAVEVTPGETILLGSVILARGKQVSGIVRNAAGQAVENAQIVANRRVRAREDTLAYRRVDEDPEMRVASTGADGTFSVKGLLAQEPVVLMAEHPSFGRSPAVRVGPDVDEVDLTLSPVQTVSGRVFQDGVALPGAAIVAADTARLVSFTTISDSAGRYALGGLPSGEYVVGAYVMDSAVRTGSTKNVVVRDRPLTRVDFALEATEVPRSQ